MDKDKIKRELLAIGISAYIKEIDYNKAMELLEIELCKHEKLVKKLNLTDVSQRSELFKSFLQKVVQETDVGDLTWQTRDEAKELLKLLNCG